MSVFFTLPRLDMTIKVFTKQMKLNCKQNWFAVLVASKYLNFLPNVRQYNLKYNVPDKTVHRYLTFFKKYKNDYSSIQGILSWSVLTLAQWHSTIPPLHYLGHCFLTKTKSNNFLFYKIANMIKPLWRTQTIPWRLYSRYTLVELYS